MRAATITIWHSPLEKSNFYLDICKSSPNFISLSDNIKRDIEHVIQNYQKPQN